MMSDMRQIFVAGVPFDESVGIFKSADPPILCHQLAQEGWGIGTPEAMTLASTDADPNRIRLEAELCRLQQLRQRVLESLVYKDRASGITSGSNFLS
jgi:hypothetical protein